ncbi:hypothetical protein [Burkholderia stagnalis]|uniref:hypothetical protein n=1 Tax=Burkholderia stagnalis TaxID=1503054 RepID=UPI000F5BDD9F|nr:hypothetical protein [Burkholderia stagnalis]RQP98062.1 hypothetical protein DF164_31690 [Burkholderia stagnalis]RQY68852.1 hypothetical protein DF110_18620 [Burkholderia stagnalis]
MQPKWISFTTATRAELAAWYLDTVGYDPTEDNPAITDDELRTECHNLYIELDNDDGAVS